MKAISAWFYTAIHLLRQQVLSAFPYSQFQPLFSSPPAQALVVNPDIAGSSPKDSYNFDERTDRRACRFNSPRKKKTQFCRFEFLKEENPDLGSRGFFIISKMLDKEPEELQFLGIIGILRESINVLRACSKHLAHITLTLILPLSFVILGHTLVSDPLLHKIQHNEDEFDKELDGPDADRTHDLISREWTRLLLFQAGYFVFLFAFSLLSTAAVVYTVACTYTAKETSFSKIMSVVPRVWRRLMLTFLWYFLIMVAYNIAVLIALVVALFLLGNDTVGFALCFIGLVTVFLAAHVYISALWHLGSVVSVLEDSYGAAAIRKSRELIRGKIVVALVLVFFYFVVCAAINGLFRRRVVHGSGAARFVWGVLLLGLLVAVNLVGLLVQSVFYYVCKSFHHQSIDKSALSDHLGEYLGEYVPLKSSIQMEPLDP